MVLSAVVGECVIPLVNERGYRRMSNKIALLIQIGSENRDGELYPFMAPPLPAARVVWCTTGLVARTPAGARSTAGWLLVPPGWSPGPPQEHDQLLAVGPI